MTVLPKWATETRYACRHRITEGGNASDPTAQYAEAAGRKTFTVSQELCPKCAVQKCGHSKAMQAHDGCLVCNSGDPE